MSATVPFDIVSTMLADCAEGYEIRRTTHFLKVDYKGRSFRTLPAYEHIEIGHIRGMVRTREIDKECANRHIPTLFNTEKSPKENPPKGGLQPPTPS